MDTSSLDETTYLDRLFSPEEQLKLADALRSQVTPDTPQEEVEGFLMQLIARSHGAFLSRFSDIGARVDEQGRLQLLDGDATLDTTTVFTLDGAAASGAIQILQEQDPELAQRFEQNVANILTA